MNTPYVERHKIDPTRADRLDPVFDKWKYGCKMHGAGLCDEWPLVAYEDQRVEGALMGD